MRTRFAKHLTDAPAAVAAPENGRRSLRRLVPIRDGAALVDAFADAFLDTPDYWDCTPRQVRADAEVEIEMTVGGHFGPWLPEASLVYGTGETLIGAILVVSWHDSPWLRSLFVRRGYRRTGIASALLRESSENLRRAGHAQVSTFASTKNQAAVAFLKAHGFSHYQEIEWKYAH